jgi:probable rRNA maturation factor
VVERSIREAAPHLGDHVEVTVLFVDDSEIRALNRQHRGIDKPTDVLSFPQLEGEEIAAPPPEAGEALLLGDVVISLQRAVAQAEEYRHSFEREVGFLAAHGTLHLLGFDHETPEAEAAMHQRTEAVLGSLGLRR